MQTLRMTTKRAGFPAGVGAALLLLALPAGAVLAATGQEGATAGGARPRKFERHFGPHHRAAGPRLEHLDLSEQQRQEIRDLRRAQAERTQPLRQRLRALQEELDAELAGAAPAVEEVGRLVVERHGLHRELGQMRQESRQALRDLLTDEQRARLDARDGERRLHRRSGPAGGRNDDPHGD